MGYRFTEDGGLVFGEQPPLRGRSEWRSVPVLLREHNEDESRQWNPALDAVESLREQEVASKPRVKGLRSKPSHPDGTASAVRVTRADGSVETIPPLDKSQLLEIHQQGKIAPRLLNLEESRRATKNRAVAREDYRNLELTAPISIA